MFIVTKNFFMKNLIYTLISTVFFFSACQHDNIYPEGETLPNSHNQLNAEEVDFLCSMGLEPSQAIVEEDQIIYQNDIVLDRLEVEKLKQKQKDRQLNVGVPYVPFRSETNGVRIYVDPSFIALGPDWVQALNDAINQLNKIRHCHAQIVDFGTLNNHDLWIFADNITTNSGLIPSCYLNLNGLGRAQFPVGEDVGRFLSIDHTAGNSWLLSTTGVKTKLILHELGHNFGMTHPCVSTGMTTTTTCGDNFFPTHIKETWMVDPQNPDACDYLSVMNDGLNAIMGAYATNPGGGPTVYGGGPTIPGGGPTINGGFIPTSNAPSPWLTGDDIFAWQAMYPDTYKPFSFELTQCFSYTSPLDYINQGNNGYAYQINYLKNDFIPYEMKFELVNSLGQVVSKPVYLYRYWPKQVNFQNVQVDPSVQCLKIRLTISNFKGDYSRTHESLNCCVM